VQTLETLTGPSDLIVMGLPPAVSEGLRAVKPPSASRPGRSVRLPRFEAPLTRPGWNVYFENWSPELFEEFRQAGGRYFVTAYPYGVRHQAAVLDYLETHGRVHAQTANWAVYTLQPAARTEMTP
jgi:hypothetical protein